MLLKTERYINKLMDIIGVIAGILLILLVLIISYNVIGRYAFSNSSIKLEELAWHFYSGVFLLGIPYALKTGSHVRVDIIFEKLSERKRALIDIVGTLFFLLPMSILIVYYGWDFMAQSYSYGEHSDSLMGLIKQFLTSGVGEKSQDPGGLLNRFIIKGLIPLSFLFLVLSGVSFLINRVNVFIHFSEKNKLGSN